MPLHRLYDLTTASLGAGVSGYKPGGAGVTVAGTPVVPGISAPRLEESTIEVLDINAPTLLAAAGTANAGIQPGLPAPSGKLLVMSPLDSIGGAKWKLNSVYQQAVARGQYGIVRDAGQAVEGGYAFTGASGNQTSGTKAIVMYDGPIQAFVETTKGGSAISAGMALCGDGAGNLTYAGASPGAGTVLATALGPVGASISIPVLTPVYVGGF